MKMKVDDKKHLIELDAQIVNIMKADRQFILDKMAENLAVDEKTNRRDLVTELDRINQARLIQALTEILPSAKILAEETQTTLADSAGLIWVIDPIDGTMNFVKQQEDFAVMVALYQDGKPLLGYIYDIMRDILLHGGVGIGKVFQNQIEIKKPVDLALTDGLIGLSGPLLIHNFCNFQAIEAKSLGARVLGSAGIEFIRVILGKQVGYISRLKPWDFAAGNALATALELKVGCVDGGPVNVLKSGVVLVATKKAYSAIINIVE
jgi:myo-inositol-1(or 4)-monophosphatase